MDITSFDLQTNEPREKAVPDDQLPSAWEEVEPGRFRPRRIKGSNVGRELGWTFVLPSRADGSAMAAEGARTL